MALTTNVYAFGSCRVLSPLAILHRHGLIKVRNRRTEWYVHSTRDILQKIDIVTGKKFVGFDQIPLLTTKPNEYQTKTDGTITLQDIDVFILEISSIKSHILGDIEVQQWCVRNLGQDAGIDMDRYNHALRIPPQERDLSFLSHNAPPLVHDIASRCVIRVLRREDVLDDLAGIEGILNPRRMILVPPINLKTENGKQIESRGLLWNTLRDYCFEKRHAFFDPAPIILQYGRDKALRDLGHYTRQFEIHLAESLLNQIHSLHLPENRSREKVDSIITNTAASNPL